MADGTSRTASRWLRASQLLALSRLTYNKICSNLCQTNAGALNGIQVVKARGRSA